MARPKRSISVLLLEDTENLGHVGDVVDVKPGFARNFLFPAGTACPVTPETLRQVERKKERAATARRERSVQLAQAAEHLEGLSLTLEERASDEGHLFGSVGATAIAEALAKRGVPVDEKQVALEVPIKELGIYNVPIRLDKDTTAEVRVWVVEPSES